MSLSRRAATLALSALLLLGHEAAHARKKPAPMPPVRSGGLIDNVNGLSTDAQGRLVRFTGLIIGEDGKVEQRLQTGDARPATPRYRLDGKGRTLIPSFVDAHVALMELGLTLLTLDLSGTASLADAQNRIATYARANPGRKWILGRGWDSARWAMTSGPTAADLDPATGDTPTLLLSADGARGWANSAALRIAGLAKITGPLTVAQTQQLVRAAPAVLPKDRDLALDKAQRALLAAGIGTVHDLGTSIEDWQSYRRAGDRGALRLRILGYARGTDTGALIAGPEPTPWLYGERLRLGGVVFSLQAPAPTPTSPQATALLNQMSRAAMDGFQVAINLGRSDAPALRDQAISMIRELAQTYVGDRRWRLDLVPPDEPTQPIKAVNFVVDPAGTLGTAALGSASPFAQLQPFRLLAMMIRPAEPESRGRALAALSRNAASIAFAETRTGALEPGQSADFLLVDRDIATASPEEIGRASVIEHWLGGHRVSLGEAAP